MRVSPISQFVANFSKRRVLVAGDAILDAAVYGHRLGTSTETTAVVAAEDRSEYTFGGASLVVRNLLALGAAGHYITVLGDDTSAAAYQTFIDPKLITTFITEAGRKNTVKKRFWVDGKMVLQFDVRDDRDISAHTQEQVLHAVTKKLAAVDLMVIADNRHGVLAAALIPRLLAAAKAAGVLVYLDSQVSKRPSNHRSYQGVDVVCCNLVEAQAIEKKFNPAKPESGLRAIRQALSAGTVVVKLGERGSAALVDRRVIETPAHRVTAVDTTGAGDAFLSALGVSHGAPWEQALELANIWAGLSTVIQGPNPPERSAFVAAVARK